MKIIVDRSRCESLGICASLAPNTFELTEDGTMVVLKEDVTPEEQATVQSAVYACPTEALLIQD